MEWLLEWNIHHWATQKTRTFRVFRKGFEPVIAVFGRPPNIRTVFHIFREIITTLECGKLWFLHWIPRSTRPAPATNILEGIWRTSVSVTLCYWFFIGLFNDCQLNFIWSKTDKHSVLRLGPISPSSTTDHGQSKLLRSELPIFSYSHYRLKQPFPELHTVVWGYQSHATRQ
jgi:hypothetical protein